MAVGLLCCPGFSCSGAPGHGDNNNHGIGVCGDGVLSLGEQCDGPSLGGQTCETLGFDGGQLACSEECRFETWRCHGCGDTIVNGAEQCDGTNLGGADCDSLGFVGGELGCLPDDCTFDTSRCSMCGNGVVDLSPGPPEVCDGAELNGQTCLLVTGLTAGELACDASCAAFDTSGCHTCGNGVREGPEECDGSDLGGVTCDTAVGHLQGTLSCQGDCTFDTSLCHTCGDGGVDGPEVCDGQWVGLETCQTQAGLPDGRLVCLPDCTGYDTSVCHTCGDGILDGPETCEDGNTVDWDGCTGCFISEIQANTYTLSYQSHPDVAVFSDGGFVVVWQSGPYAEIGQDGDLFGVFGQRFDSAGQPVGSELQVNTYFVQEQWRPSVAAAADGSFTVVWSSEGQDGSGAGVFGQRFDSAGLPDGTEFQVNTYTLLDQDLPRIAMTAGGDFVVAWQSANQDNSGSGVYARRFDAAGVPQGGEIQANTYTWSEQTSPDVAMADDGTFVVVWESWGQDGDEWGVFAQRFDGAGLPLGGELQVNTHVADKQRSPAVAMAPSGSFVVVWQSRGQDLDGSYGIMGQRYDGQGSPVGGELQVNTCTTGTQWHPSVAMNGDGSFTVVWESWEQDGIEWGIFGQRFDNAGNPAGSEFQVNHYFSFFQVYPAVSALVDGRFIVTWQSELQDGDRKGIFLQRYSCLGQRLGAAPF